MLFLARVVMGLFFCLPLATARTLEVGPGKSYAQPSQAVHAARDGDRIVIAGGHYYDCAVLERNNLVIEGAADGTTVMTDTTCQGKAILVVAGNDVTVRNLTLTRARVPDMNGAGIRAEGSNLLVDRVRFIDNQNGILGASQSGSRVIIRDSEFVRNGTCEADCAHGIYINDVALLRVERSRFTETRSGHHIKSRARRTEIKDCDISDGPTGTASYLVDIPNGGGVSIRNNRLSKGPRAENRSAAIMIGAERVDRPTPEIRIEGNVFTAEGGYPTVFVVNQTATSAMLSGNQIHGRARALRGDGRVYEEAVTPAR